MGNKGFYFYFGIKCPKMVLNFRNLEGWILNFKTDLDILAYLLTIDQSVKKKTDVRLKHLITKKYKLKCLITWPKM